MDFKSIYNIEEIYFNGIVVDYKLNDDYLTFTLKGKELMYPATLKAGCS